MTAADATGRRVDAAVTRGCWPPGTCTTWRNSSSSPRWISRNLPELRTRFPAVPERVWRSVERIDAREFALAVGAMAAIVGSAAVAGSLTGGRSRLYQGALTAFGVHGLVHIGQAAAVRRYTPGSATSPLLVVPFTLWARGRLRRAGVLRPTRPRDAVTGLAAAAAATVLWHAAARRVTRAGRRRAA